MSRRILLYSLSLSSVVLSLALLLAVMPQSVGAAKSKQPLETWRLFDNAGVSPTTGYVSSTGIGLSAPNFNTGNAAFSVRSIPKTIKAARLFVSVADNQNYDGMVTISLEVRNVQTNETQQVVVAPIDLASIPLKTWTSLPLVNTSTIVGPNSYLAIKLIGNGTSGNYNSRFDIEVDVK